MSNVNEKSSRSLVGLLIPALGLLVACAGPVDDTSEFDLPAYSRQLATSAPAQVLGLDTPLRILLENPDARLILLTYDPSLVSSPDVARAYGYSLRFLSHFPATGLTDDVMAQIAQALGAVKVKADLSPL